MHRELLWEDLGAIRGMWREPWCIGGDFYVIRFPYKKNREGRISSSMRRFSQIIDEMELKDLHLKGGSFTWRGGLNNQRMARLDRFLVIDGWDDHFDGAEQSLLSRCTSDHFPMLLEGGLFGRGPLPFMFENMWLRADGFKILLKEWWQNIEVRGLGSYVLTEKLKAIKVKLKDWNREVFGRVDVGKNLALKKVVYWDAVEAQRPLFLNEYEEKVAALESFKSWASLEETFWREK